MTSPHATLSLKDLEKVLYRESSIIAKNDIPILISLLRKEIAKARKETLLSDVIETLLAMGPGTIDVPTEKIEEAEKILKKIRKKENKMRTLK